MEINYTWGFGKPDCIISKDGMNQIVKTIHWNLTGEIEGATGYVYGTVSLPMPSSLDDFTPYVDLPEEWFIQQVESNIDMDSVYKNIEGQINEKLNPTIDTPPLPWDINPAVQDLDN